VAYDGNLPMVAVFYLLFLLFVGSALADGLRDSVVLEGTT